MASNQGSTRSATEPLGVYSLCAGFCVAAVQLPTQHFSVRVGGFQQLRFLQFAWTPLHIRSRAPVALDSGHSWPGNSGSVLDTDVLDGV